MYKEVGRKMKTVASVIATLGIIGSVLLGIILVALHSSLLPIALVCMIVGSLASWFGGLCFYASGELVDNSEIQTGLLYQMLNCRVTPVGPVGEQPANGTNARIPTWKQVQQGSEPAQNP